MKTTVYNRQIFYDFEHQEAAFLQSIGAWETIKKNLQPHESITIEGYERIETDGEEANER